MTHNRRKYFWTLFTTRNQMSCYYCNKQLKLYPWHVKGYIDDRLTIDHLWPICLGGKHNDGNCVPACQKCNQKKGSKTIDELTGYISFGLA